MLLIGAKAHYRFYASSIVPAAIEDNDLAGRRKMLNVTLDIQLGLFPLGGRRQRDDAKDTRAHPFGDRLYCSSLPSGVTAFEDHNHAQALVLDPFLKLA